MNITLNKSSLLAAIEISKNVNLLKSEDLSYLESVKSTFDIKGGQKLIELIGIEIISELNSETNENNYQIILRKILNRYLRDEKPGFLLRITGGRDYFLNYIHCFFRPSASAPFSMPAVKPNSLHRCFTSFSPPQIFIATTPYVLVQSK